MTHRVRFQGVAQFGHAALTPKRDVTQSDAACPTAFGVGGHMSHGRQWPKWLSLTRT